MPFPGRVMNYDEFYFIMNAHNSMHSGLVVFSYVHPHLCSIRFLENPIQHTQRSIHAHINNSLRRSAEISPMSDIYVKQSANSYYSVVYVLCAKYVNYWLVIRVYLLKRGKSIS